MIFNYYTIDYSFLDINLNNTIIKNVPNAKILGLTLDKLNFNLNVKNLKAVCNKYLNILKKFSKAKGGAHPKRMLNI